LVAWNEFLSCINLCCTLGPHNKAL